MAFWIKRKESVSKAIRRVARERIKDALGCLEDGEHGEAIHCARKDIKKVRALLRLAGDGISRKKSRIVTKSLRKAAQHLAPVRDACVRRNTLSNLKRHFKGQLAPAALRHISAQLLKAFEKEMKRFVKKRTAKTARRLLQHVAKELKRLNISGGGWKVLRPGVKTTYAAARCAYHIVRGDSSPENFHEWRKRAKDLRYQVTLLRRVWPEQMEAMAGELKILGENLGNDHDLAMLREAVERERAGENQPGTEWETLYGLIEARQGELRAAALALGARFFAEKPSAFCDRLAGYWQIWRGEKIPLAPGH